MSSQIESPSFSFTDKESDKKLFPRIVAIPVKTRLLAFIEQTFWETGDFPTAEEAAEKLSCPVESIKRLWADEEFQDSLASRGIKYRSPEDGLLTPEQMVVANVFLNTLDKTSIRTTLQAMGISQVKYNSWQNDPAYIGYIRKRSEQMYDNADAQAYKSLIQAIERGDQRAIELYFKMKGIYNDKLQVDLNINEITVMFVDILHRHIKDPELLEAIASDLDSINGQTTGNIGPIIQGAISRGDQK